MFILPAKETSHLISNFNTTDIHRYSTYSSTEYRVVVWYCSTVRTSTDVMNYESQGFFRIQYVSYTLYTSSNGRIRRGDHKTTMLAGSRAVRWLSTSKQSTIAPFEAQLTSATQRHREARRKRQEQQHQAPTEADDGKSCCGSIKCMYWSIPPDRIHGKNEGDLFVENKLTQLLKMAVRRCSTYQACLWWSAPVGWGRRRFAGSLRIGNRPVPKEQTSCG